MHDLNEWSDAQATLSLGKAYLMPSNPTELCASTRAPKKGSKGLLKILQESFRERDNSQCKGIELRTLLIRVSLPP